MICVDLEEDCQHVVTTCVFAKDCWEKLHVLCWIELYPASLQQLKHLVFGSSMATGVQQLVVCLVWLI